MSTPVSPVPLDAYWGIIQSGVRVRLTTAELWAAVRHSSEIAGETLATGSFQRMNQLRGLAAEQRTTDASFDRLSRDQTITSSEIALDINSRDAISRSLNPRFRVGFEVTGTRISSGATVSIRLTDTFGANLPSTKGDLLDALDFSAPGLGQDSDLELQAVTGGISIRAV